MITMSAYRQPVRNHPALANAARLERQLNDTRSKLEKALADLAMERDRARKAEAEALMLRQKFDQIRGPVVESAAVIKAVCKVWEMTEAELRHCSRDMLRTSARHMAMLLMRVHCPQMSSPDIARALGLSDHTTILYGVKKAQKRVADGGPYARRYQEADAILREGAANG